MKNITKALISTCMIFAFLLTPVTKLFTKITKVFATSNTLTDSEGENVKVEGFIDNGKVGEKVYLPKVSYAENSYMADTESDLIVYNIKTPAGKTVAAKDIAVEEDEEVGNIGKFYFIPTEEGTYTLEIQSVSDTKLETIVSGLNIHVTKAEADFSIKTSAVVADGEKANILPAKITLADLASQDFKIDAPETEGDVTNIVVTCSPAGSTGASDNYTLNYNDKGYFEFKSEDMTKLTSAAKYGKYTFEYAYVVTNGGTKTTLKTITSTCEVVKEASFEEDIKLAFGSLTGSSELSNGEIGKWVKLPTATIYDSATGSTDAIPSVLTIKVTPSSSIADANVEIDGYSFKADKIGKYQITYTASYPYTDLTVKKNFTIELKDETAPTVVYAGNYDARDTWFAAQTDDNNKTEEKYLEYIKSVAFNDFQTVYVVPDGGQTVNISIPAIYAEDNSTDGKYELSREVVYNNVTTEISEEDNKVATFPVDDTKQGVYTVNYRVKDSSNKSTLGKRIFVVLSESAIKDFEDKDTLNEVSKPDIKTGTAPRNVKSNGTLSVSLPSATDAITDEIKEEYSKLSNNSYSSWYSHVEVTTTLQGYKMVGDVETEVTGAKYVFSENDIDESGKYTINMQDVVTASWNINEVEYFRLVYTAKTDWMGDGVDPSKVSSSKIDYINVGVDTTAATIATAFYDGVNFIGRGVNQVIYDYNFNIIEEVIRKYNERNPGATIYSNGTLSANGMLSATLAPFNQYSAEEGQNNKVKLPDLIITDNEDAKTLSVSGVITDSLGNKKFFLPNIVKVNTITVSDDVDNIGYQYFVELGEYALTTAGQYTVSVTATDKGGNVSVYSFALFVNDTTGPSDVVLDVELLGDSTISTVYNTGEEIIFPEANIEDNTSPNSECSYEVRLTNIPDGARVENVSMNGFTPYTAGTYEITYYCQDGNGNKFEKVYTLEVKDKDHTDIVVKESVFTSYGIVCENGYRYAFNESLTTNKIVIPYASTINPNDSSKAGISVKPTVKKNSVTQTVTEDTETGNYTFNAIQGVYTVEYKYGSVTKTYTLYIGDTEVPTIKWLKDVPATLDLNAEWGAGVYEMFEVTDYKLGADNTENVEIERVEIIDPDNKATILTGENSYKFTKEGSYTLKVTFSDGINDQTATKTITVSSEEGEVSTNPTNVVGTILLIASILVVGGVVLYLILSSKKNTRKAEKKSDK